MIDAIMAVPERQYEKACRLRDYCLRLDQTHVTVLKITEEEDANSPVAYKGNAFHCLQAWALRRAALYMRDRPFFWLEADSIPLKPGWLEKLTGFYNRECVPAGKIFLISSDHQKFDQVGGIGVYPAATSWLVPTDFQHSSWDLWLILHLSHLVSRTPLIQHSYGHYSQLGIASEHRFPRDQSMIRPDALIFHRDPNQDLIL